MRLHQSRIALRPASGFLGVFVFSAVLAALALYVKHYHGIIPLTEAMLLSYVNPLMIICSVSLFLFFYRLRIQSKVINYISASCLSVYLIHGNIIVAPYYHDLFWNEFKEGKYLLFIATIIGVFLFCVIADQFRQLIYRIVLNRFPVQR